MKHRVSLVLTTAAAGGQSGGKKSHFIGESLFLVFFCYLHVCLHEVQVVCPVCTQSVWEKLFSPEHISNIITSEPPQYLFCTLSRFFVMKTPRSFSFLRSDFASSRQRRGRNPRSLTSDSSCSPRTYVLPLDMIARLTCVGLLPSVNSFYAALCCDSNTFA